MASMSSQLYGATVTALLEELTKKPDAAEAGSLEPELHVNLDDEVVRGAIVLHEGKMLWPAPVKELPPPPEPGVPTRSAAAMAAAKSSSGHGRDEGAGVSPWLLGAVAVIMVGLAFIIPPKPAGLGSDFLGHLTVFIGDIPCFQVFWKGTRSTRPLCLTNPSAGSPGRRMLRYLRRAESTVISVHIL